MGRIISFIGCILCALIAIPIVKEIIDEMDLENVEGITDVELSLWQIMPLALLVSLFIVSLATLVISFKKREERYD